MVFDSCYSTEQLDAFVEGLELFSLGWSWGRAYSIVMSYDITAIRTVCRWPHRRILMRFILAWRVRLICTLTLNKVSLGICDKAAY
ncbi:hypothetical protein [Candidatus Vallotiella sp. (ex Adelges kitamiensis)]|uniref:hypothetical protein n=1 Tax=Candidatus Vallotiella sp. (ex Adelges kitamiensis) TaxID=2864217 RepID=UPI001CE3078F|nr:hypothetical protein [Candidatus Vallotia sp. (ex Adelges kitamiensis)]